MTKRRRKIATWPRPDDGNWRMLSANERKYLDLLEAIACHVGRMAKRAYRPGWEDHAEAAMWVFDSLMAVSRRGRAPRSEEGKP